MAFYSMWNYRYYFYYLNNQYAVVLLCNNCVDLNLQKMCSVKKRPVNVCSYNRHMIIISALTEWRQKCDLRPKTLDPLPFTNLLLTLTYFKYFIFIVIVTKKMQIKRKHADEKSCCYIFCSTTESIYTVPVQYWMYKVVTRYISQLHRYCTVQHYRCITRSCWWVETILMMFLYKDAIIYRVYRTT